MQSELKLVKEFRRKRAQMQKELDEVINEKCIVLNSNNIAHLISSSYCIFTTMKPHPHKISGLVYKETKSKKN